MTGIIATLVGMGATTEGTVSLSNTDAYKAAIDPDTATATYSLNASGALTATGGTSGFWITPQSGMDLFEARATLNTGALSSGSVNTWLPLSTTRSWQTSQSGEGVQTANLSIQIRRASDVTVVASATVTVTAEVLSV